LLTGDLAAPNGSRTTACLDFVLQKKRFNKFGERMKTEAHGAASVGATASQVQRLLAGRPKLAEKHSLGLNESEDSRSKTGDFDSG
jgi:hypothetical protein